MGRFSEQVEDVLFGCSYLGSAPFDRFLTEKRSIMELNSYAVLFSIYLFSAKTKGGFAAQSD